MSDVRKYRTVLAVCPFRLHPASPPGLPNRGMPCKVVHHELPEHYSPARNCRRWPWPRPWPSRVRRDRRSRRVKPVAVHRRQGTGTSRQRPRCRPRRSGHRAEDRAAIAQRRLRAGAPDGRRARHLRLRRAASRDPELRARATAAAAARVTRRTTCASSRAAIRRATCSSGTRTASAARCASTWRARRCSSTRRAPTCVSIRAAIERKWTPDQRRRKDAHAIPAEEVTTLRRRARHSIRAFVPFRSRGCLHGHPRRGRHHDACRQPAPEDDLRLSRRRR